MSRFRDQLTILAIKMLCIATQTKGRKRNGLSLNQTKSKMILIAGPYRSGTHDNPALIQKNVETMESYALAIFRAGHIPLLGEWLALPLVNLAGSKRIGDNPFNEIFHPIAGSTT
jgi:hypothetical protein